jgi:hypothetical protein
LAVEFVGETSTFLADTGVRIALLISGRGVKGEPVFDVFWCHGFTVQFQVVIMGRWLAGLVLAVIVVTIGVLAGAVFTSVFDDDRVGVVVPLDSPVR